MGGVAIFEVSDAEAWIFSLADPLARGERGTMPLPRLSGAC
jgi:hypothetical protein